MITSLLEGRAYPHATTGITVVETHISWVLLTGPYAYKVKKPVSLGFLDFSTLELRRHSCQEELRLNRRLAPGLYLDLVEIHGPMEAAHIGGAGPMIEVAVRMRQFAQEDLLPQALRAGRVDGQQMETFANQLADFHHAAAVASAAGPFGTPRAVLAPAKANLEVLHQTLSTNSLLCDLQAWTEAEAARLEGVFSQRLEQGRVRECHGDLHLGNLVLHHGEVVGFDCLEFNPSLRWIDVLSDVAFLAMDLQHHGEPVLAGRTLNRWLMASGDYGALLTWPWYQTYRALVRAKVLSLRLAQHPEPEISSQGDLEAERRRYLRQAADSSGGACSGALLLTHGVAGSGKSHIASHLCRRHGWMHLRSDVERLRRFGHWGTCVESLRQGDPYSPEITAELYSSLLPAAAEAVIRGGLTAVVDATFLKRSQRETFLVLAERLGVPVVILVCPVTLATARRRIAQRNREGLDPSEATEAVLEQQWQAIEPPGEGEAEVQITATDPQRVEAALRTTRLRPLLAC